MALQPISPASAFEQSWRGVSGLTISPGEYQTLGKLRYLTGGRTRRDVGGRGGPTVRVGALRAGMVLSVQESEEMKRFLRRLPRASAYFKREMRKTLRKAVTEEFLRPLKENIPIRKGKKIQTRVSRDIKIHRTKRGRTQAYGAKRHIRHTARVSKAEATEMTVLVGNADLWYGAALHSKVPFFPLTVAMTQHKLEARLDKEMYDLFHWLETGRRRRVGVF